jgi:hypothetical protein
MASSLVMSLIGAAGLAAALLVGCGDNDAKPVASKAGQSCARTADCADGLSCIANVCYSSTASGGGSGGSGGAAVVGPVLGGDGESCASRKDCGEGLACFNQRCTKSDTTIGAGGDTGTTTPTAQLGTRGETCRVNADCAKDLACVPGSTAGSIGVCDVTNYGVVPTGMYCAGECGVATDCCQLPVLEQTAEGIKSCPDLTALIASSAVDCTATPENKLCFLDATYCSGCSRTTWKCTDSACVYNVACTVAAGVDTDKGCPQYTRLGNVVPACNAKSLTCTGASGCTNAPSCVGLNVADSLGTDTCSDGECVCNAGDHQCYRSCTRDLDCATGKVCDKTSRLCTPDTVCTTDAQCAERNGSLAYKCQQDTHTCALTCAVDRDCSPSGRIVNGARVDTFSSSVCVAGLCTSVAGDCVDDSQCGATGGYKTFCIARPDLTAGTSVSSAVTN